jgi:hypothetical protein
VAEDTTLLQKLLEKVATGGVHIYDDLRRELDVSQGLLEQMLIDLGRMGYLKRVNTGCEEHCAGCPLSGACAVGQSGQVWTLTEKVSTGRSGGKRERV